MLKRLRFLDETLRNGQQALWATRMRTASMLPIAPVMDEAGFDEVCVAAGVSFETSAMYLFEDPWERLRLLREHMPNTRLEALVRDRNLWGWTSQPCDVMDLFLRTLLRNGVDSIKVSDPLNDYRNLAPLVRTAKGLGFRVKGVLGYTVSPAHTDAYLAGKARELADLGVDALALTDAAGIMHPERGRGAIRAVRDAIGGLEMHFQAHTITGLADLCYREAIRAGVDVVWTAARPLAYGKSLPSTMAILRMSREEGRPADLDERRVREIDDWFHWVAYEEGRPIAAEVRFDPRLYERYAGHQIPGGMFSNLVRQLRDLHIEHRLPEVLEEAARVRAELGYPHMVTPYSQMVGVQATLNVMEGRRYATVPEALRLYARGYFGRPVRPLDPALHDLLAGDAPALDPLEGFDEPVLPRVRAEHGPFESDEDLLLFLFLNPAAYGRYRRERRPITWDPRRSPVAALVRELAGRRDLARVSVRRGPLHLEVSRAPSGGGSPEPGRAGRPATGCPGADPDGRPGSGG